MNQTVLENVPTLREGPPDLGGLPVEARAIVGQLVLAIRAETRQALEAVKLEMRAIVQDNSVLRENLSLLNKSLGEFREREAMPLRDALQDFNTNAGSRVAENQANLEKLIQSLCRIMEAAKIPIPDDIAKEIRDGRFEGLKHAVANEVGVGLLREPGSDPLENLR